MSRWDYCVAANSPTTTAVQWWQIAIDGGGAGNGTVTDQERVGSTTDKYNGFDGNATDPSIAVNAAGDALVGCAEIPYDSATSSFGYLSTAYAFQSHSDCQEASSPVTYGDGAGPYPPPSAVTGSRTGDYSGTQVDPLDDTSFITAAANAGAQSGSYYWWEQCMARVKPVAPPRPTFIASANVETECVISDTSCTTTVTAPNKSADNDMFFVVVSAGLNPSSITVPSGWVGLPLVNKSNHIDMAATDSCGTETTAWSFAKKFSGTH